MKHRIILAVSKEELQEYSDSLADILCWAKGFMAACPEDTNRHPLNVDVALRFHDKIKQELKASKTDKVVE